MSFTRRKPTLADGRPPQGSHFSDKDQAIDGNHLGVRWSSRLGPQYPDLTPVRRVMNGVMRRKKKAPVSLAKVTLQEGEPE